MVAVDRRVITLGVVGRMAKPVLLPEPFSGETADWNEWLSHFESVAVVNKWETGGEKLKWLRVCLTGKVQTALMKLPDAARDNYGECVKALKKRFVPDSRNDLTSLSYRRGRNDEKRTGPHSVTI